jgi:hypothetical protein
MKRGTKAIGGDERRRGAARKRGKRKLSEGGEEGKWPGK